MWRWMIRIATHGVALAVGFALGVYLLPILTAPPSPDSAMLEQSAEGAVYSAELTRDLPGSDFLHWGEGTISLSPERIVHEGRLSPGPDYKLYLVPEFVDHEDAFLPIKGEALQLGDIDTFEGFVVDLPAGVDLDAYTTVLVWCEAFSEFITAAEYR
ncbi:MAG: DM13 domain-containing protein [Pseudomonadota bacterium]